MKSRLTTLFRDHSSWWPIALRFALTGAGILLWLQATEGWNLPGDWVVHFAVPELPRLGVTVSRGTQFLLQLWAVALMVLPWVWPKLGGSNARKVSTFAHGSMRPFLLGLLTIVVLAAWIRLPRLQLSFFGDEDYSLRRFIHGQYDFRDTAKPPKFRPLGWMETIWGYHRPNNHILYSVAARGSLELWRSLNDLPKTALTEWVPRLPSYLAGLASIAVLGALLAAHGLPRAGLLAALVLSMHPWHINHSVGVRGYSFVFLFSLGALWAASLMASRGGRKPWLAFVGCCVALLWTYPAMLYLVVCLLAIMMTGALLKGRFHWLPAWNAADCVKSMLVMALLLLPLATIAAPQLLYYVRELGEGTALFGLSGAMEAAAYGITGTGWEAWADPGHPLMQSWAVRLHEAPLLWMAFLLLLMGLVVWGCWGVLRRPYLGASMLAVPLAALIQGIVSLFSSQPVCVWYFVYAVPFFCAACGLALDRMMAAGRGVVSGIAVLLLVVGWMPQLLILRSHSREPLREAANATVATAKMYEGQGKKVVACSLYRLVELYSPSIYPFRSPDELHVRIEERRERSLFVVLTRGVTPWEMTPAHWEAYQPMLEAVFHGPEAENSTYRLWKLQAPG